MTVNRLVATNNRLLARGCEALNGICMGLVADGQLNDQEITFLSTWLAANSELSTTWPGEVVYARVTEVLKDGSVSQDEREYLLKTLQQLIGGDFQETGAVPDGSTELGFDSVDSIHFESRVFCFTGQFLYGTRSACERAMTSVGAECAGSINKNTDYLIVGAMASRDWKNTSHGLKIEKAMQLKKDGSDLKILTEAIWVGAITAKGY
jgi:NAD-dependent DNA ligase